MNLPKLDLSSLDKGMESLAKMAEALEKISVTAENILIEYRKNS